MDWFDVKFNIVSQHVTVNLAPRCSNEKLQSLERPPCAHIKCANLVASLGPLAPISCAFHAHATLTSQNSYSHVNSSATTLYSRMRELLRKQILACKIEGVHASKYWIFVQGYKVMI